MERLREAEKTAQDTLALEYMQYDRRENDRNDFIRRLEIC